MSLRKNHYSNGRPNPLQAYGASATSDDVKEGSCSGEFVQVADPLIRTDLQADLAVPR